MPTYTCKATIKAKNELSFGTIIADDIDEAIDGAYENLGEDIYEQSVTDDFKDIFQDLSAWTVTCKKQP